ncbi:unnamed protein product [marine sediment metagenome]|uniref:Uncharacterized protein n=1 Tax=marine sediment metagenome TaxID=412755 RepID=X1JXH5_9ZZZZ
MERLAYKNNKRLHDILRRYSPSELKVIRLFLKCGEEYYVMPREEYEKKSDEEAVPIIYRSDIQGENPKIKRGIENLVSYVREKGIPIYVDEDTWRALDFPLAAFPTLSFRQ